MANDGSVFQQPVDRESIRAMIPMRSSSSRFRPSNGP